MPTEREKMLAGELYNPLDPDLAARLARARDLCSELNATRESDQDQRRLLLKKLLGAGGDTAVIQPPFFCDYGENTYLGYRVFFNYNCVVLDDCKVKIGDNSMFGPAVQIYTAAHPLNAQLRRGPEFCKPIEIGADVRIGDRTVIGAGSVVTRDIPSDVLAVGNPCRVVRAIEQS
jgi:maltose O-acetyltransferase